MSLTDWADMMPHTITYEACLAHDDYGKPLTYAAAVSYQARVRYKSQRVSSQTTGQDTVAAGNVWIAALMGISASDRITLPDGTQPPIISWECVPDETGDHHTNIFFGAA